MNLATLVKNAQKELNQEKKEKQEEINCLERLIKRDEEKLEILRKQDQNDEWVHEEALSTLESINHMTAKLFMAKN